MKRTLLLMTLVGGLALSTGCSLCSSHQDAAYSNYGGRVPRYDMYQGRVGSILDPAGAAEVIEAEPAETGDSVLGSEEDMPTPAGAP